VEGEYGQVIADVPGFRIAGNDLSGCVIGYKAFEAVAQERNREGIVRDIRVDAIRLIAEYKCQLLSVCQSLFGNGGAACQNCAAKRESKKHTKSLFHKDSPP
jgi:hypothetical protein